ncbi:MAG: AMP-binding protein [Steroidobacteraceae bacterium]
MTPGKDLISGGDSRPLAWHRGRVVTVGEFRLEAGRVAAALPASGVPVLNLCEDRFRFLLAYAAAALRGVASLLPPSRAPDVVAEVAACFDEAFVCDDEWVAAAATGSGPGSSCAADRDTATVTYTSGSTGRPQPHARAWSGLVKCTHAKRGLLGPELDGSGGHWIVATVPAQHMYGLEFSVLLPLLGDCAVHCGRPILPADVADALREVPGRRVLVTTPLHLRVLVESGIPMPTIDRVICATAPLDPALAGCVEAAWRCPVLEVFGSTETCAIAQREPVRQARWSPFDGVSLVADDVGARVCAPWLPGFVRLLDRVDVDEGGRFVVIGRNSDLIEVAGKRASLGDLTRRLLGVEGVRDAVVVQVEGGRAELRRVAALVVAPGLRPDIILERLRVGVDPVFLPRPLLIVDALPRNELGKLSRERVLEALGILPPAD